MLFFRRVSGNSMQPTLGEGQIVVGSTRRRYVPGDVVVAWHGEKEIIKRVKKIKKDSVWLEGDNSSASTDSRQFGWADESAILGVMKFTFPQAVHPPKPRTAYGILLGRVAAGVLVAFSLLHLFRIDTFVPELARVFNNNSTAAFWAASLVITAEVFGLPFLMRMKLSPLAQYVSGALAVFAPLFWLLVAIWTVGTGVSTAQLGEFMGTPSDVLLIMVNTAWVALSYWTIWALGYDRRTKTKKDPQ